MQRYNVPTILLNVAKPAKGTILAKLNTYKEYNWTKSGNERAKLLSVSLQFINQPIQS